MNNFTQNYEKILETLQSIEVQMNFLNQIRKPKLSDIELIAIDLTSEYMSIDSEYQLFRILPSCLSDKIERSVYNRRKRKLFYHREQLRKKLASQISSDDYYIVDSMPLEVCKLSRSTRSRICKEKKCIIHLPIKGIALPNQIPITAINSCNMHDRWSLYRF